MIVNTKEIGKQQHRREFDFVYSISTLQFGASIYCLTFEWKNREKKTNNNNTSSYLIIDRVSDITLAV